MGQSIFAYSKRTWRMIGTASLVLASLIILSSGHQVRAATDTCTWTGSGADSNLTTAGNWTGCDNGAVPESGDDIVFPAGPTNKTITLDAAMEFASVTFSGSGYTVETTDLPNNQLYITSALTISGDNTTFNSFVRFFNDSGVTLTHSGTGTTFSHYIVMQPGVGDPDVTLDIQTDMAVPMISQTTGSVGLVSKSGSGTLEITGNAIAGMVAVDGIEISAGRWKCDSRHCLGDTSNIITLSAGGVPADAVLEFAQADTIRVGTIVGDGTIALTNADAIVEIGGGGASGTFSGTVEGYAASILNVIAGTWTFTGVNRDGGNGFSSYYLNGGTFIAQAADTSLSMSPFSISDGVLGGTDIIGSVTVYSGTIAPGTSPGCLYPAGNVAFNGDVSFLDIQINGSTACTGYDVLNASGDVILNGAVLNMSLLGGYNSTYGTVFTVVQGHSVNGTFKGLNDGDVITVGGLQFRINYTEAAVTLTDITPHSSAATSSDLASTGDSLVGLSTVGLVLLAASSCLYLRRRSVL